MPRFFLYLHQQWQRPVFLQLSLTIARYVSLYTLGPFQARSKRNCARPTRGPVERRFLIEWTDCRILGRHFGRVSVPAHVHDKYKVLMADRELAFVSGRARRLFPRVRFHFWPQRRRYTCILFLSCDLPRSRSRQNSRARQRTDPLRPVNLKLEVAWPWTWSACAADSSWWIYWWTVSSRGSGGRLVSITWWSANVVVRCSRRVRQTLFHTVGGTGTLRRDKERGVLGVGVLFRDHVPGSGAWRFFCGRPGVFCVLPSFGRATIVSPPCRVQSCFGRSSCQPSTRRRSRDALPAKGCTCWSGWSQHAFKHCLVALYRDRGICSSKDACLFLLKRPPTPGMLGEQRRLSTWTLCQRDWCSRLLSWNNHFRRSLLHLQLSSPPSTASRQPVVYWPPYTYVGT